MISVTAIREPITRDEALGFLIEYLNAEGFDTDTWQEGEIERTLLVLQSVMLADLTHVVARHAEWTFNETASGEALNVFSRSRYSQEKLAARKTVGLVTLTSTATVPYTDKAPGSIVVATADGIEFVHVGSEDTIGASVTIPAGGTVDVQVEARIAGAGGNVATSAISKLLTPLAGVTVENTGSPWYTVSGRDEESDASLQRRNQVKWASMTPELIALSYEAIARDPSGDGSGEGGASKVFVDDSNPRGAGTIDVIVAGETALLSDPEAEALQLAFSQRAFDTDEDWPAAADSRVSVEHADELELDVTATVYHDPNVTGAIMSARLRAAMIAFLSATPLGGYRYLPDNDHVILVDDVREALRRVPGVRAVILTTPADTISVDIAEMVVEGTWSITPVAQQG